jgi:RNA-directed DNA polymerase
MTGDVRLSRLHALLRRDVGDKFTVKRRTHSQRMARKLSEIRLELKHRMHLAVKAQHTWLSAVLRGHYQDFGVMFNSQSLTAFYKCVKLAWFNALRKRSQKRGMTWERYATLLGVFPLPKPRVIHQPWRGYGARQDIFRKSPLPESGTMGSVGAKTSNG